MLAVSREPEPLERERARRRLHDEREQAGRGVVDREEAEQRFAAAERFDRLRLEDVVDERGAHRAEQHERGEIAQVRRSATARAGPTAASRRQIGRAVHGSPAPDSRRENRSCRTPAAPRTAPAVDLPRADEIQRRQHRQHAVTPNDAADALGDERRRPAR